MAKAWVCSPAGEAGKVKWPLGTSDWDGADIRISLWRKGLGHGILNLLNIPFSAFIYNQLSSPKLEEILVLL